MLGLLIGLVHAVKAPLMFPFLRNMVALGKGSWQQCCSCTKRCFMVLFPCQEVTDAELEGLCAVVWALKLHFLLKVPRVPALLVTKTNAMQMSQGRESSFLQHYLGA